MIGQTLHKDDRAVSIAVTHVLAIGITTILISTLLIGASGVLQDQKERAAREELNTIGNRVSTQITTAARLAQTSDTEVEFVVNQPTRVSGGTYTLELDDSSITSARDTCDDASIPPNSGPDGCLVLETTNLNVVVTVPVHIPGSPTLNVEVVGSGKIEITAS